MPKNGVGIVNLATGQATTVAEHVKSFRVPDDTPKIVVYLTVAAETGSGHRCERPSGVAEGARKETDPGTDLVVRDLSSGAQTTVAEVSDYALSKDGDWLAYAVSSKTPANDGAFARSMASGATRTLLTGLGNYKRFVFDGGARQAAFVSDRDDFTSRRAALQPLSLDVFSRLGGRTADPGRRMR